VLSQKTRYALKALVALSGLAPGDSLSSAAIAAARNIPPKFLETILADLTRQGLVWGQRGRYGGYRLAKEPKDISFGSVVRLMQGPLALVQCVSHTQYRRCSDCPDERSCEIHKLFKVVRDSTAMILDQHTLADAAGPPPKRRASATVRRRRRN
jgi:Rrf2 family protein